MPFLVAVTLDALPSHRAEIRDEMSDWCRRHCCGGFEVDLPDQAQFRHRDDAERFRRRFGGEFTRP